MGRHLSFIASLVFGLMVVAAMTIFTVDQRQFAIIFQLGEIREVITEPGLAFKWPLIQNVKVFDKRILTLDSPEPERFLTAEKKPVLVDSFVKWRIHDVKQYYVSVAGDEQVAKTRLAQTVNSGLREEFGKRTVHDVVSGERDDVMASLRGKADADARRYGVQVLDVRIKRVDFGSGGSHLLNKLFRILCCSRNYRHRINLLCRSNNLTSGFEEFGISRGFKKLKRYDVISSASVNYRRIYLVSESDIGNNAASALAHTVNLGNLNVIAFIHCGAS